MEVGGCRECGWTGVKPSGTRVERIDVIGETLQKSLRDKTEAPSVMTPRKIVAQDPSVKVVFSTLPVILEVCSIF